MTTLFCFFSSMICGTLITVPKNVNVRKMMAREKFTVMMKVVMAKIFAFQI